MFTYLLNNLNNQLRVVLHRGYFGFWLWFFGLCLRKYNLHCLLDLFLSHSFAVAVALVRSRCLRSLLSLCHICFWYNIFSENPENRRYVPCPYPTFVGFISLPACVCECVCFYHFFSVGFALLRNVSVSCLHSICEYVKRQWLPKWIAKTRQWHRHKSMANGQVEWFLFLLQSRMRWK